MVKDQGVISDGSDMRAIASLSRNYQTRMEWDLVRGKLSSAFVGEEQPRFIFCVVNKNDAKIRPNRRI